MSRNITNFSLSPEGKAEIERRLGLLLEACQIYQVPMFASVAVAGDEQSTKYNNITYGASAHNMELADDQITKHILIANGFDAIPPRDTLTLDVNYLTLDESDSNVEGKQDNG